MVVQNRKFNFIRFPLTKPNLETDMIAIAANRTIILLYHIA